MKDSCFASAIACPLKFARINVSLRSAFLVDKGATERSPPAVRRHTIRESVEHAPRLILGAFKDDVKTRDIVIAAHRFKPVS